MPQLPEPLERLIQELSRLPGIGPKTAQRLAFHLLRVDRVRADSLAQAIEDVKARIGYCERCYNIAEGSLRWICAAPRQTGWGWARRWPAGGGSSRLYRLACNVALIGGIIGRLLHRTGFLRPGKGKKAVRPVGISTLTTEEGERL